jgi:hypothetical protein
MSEHGLTAASASFHACSKGMRRARASASAMRILGMAGCRGRETFGSLRSHKHPCDPGDSRACNAYAMDERDDRNPEPDFDALDDELVSQDAGAVDRRRGSGYRRAPRGAGDAGRLAVGGRRARPTTARAGRRLGVSRAGPQPSEAELVAFSRHLLHDVHGDLGARCGRDATRAIGRRRSPTAGSRCLGYLAAARCCATRGSATRTRSV